MDRIFYNGKIYAIDQQNSFYTAIGTENGRIVFLGNDDQAAEIEADEKINLAG